jgi:hypothetical protein
MIVMGAGDGLDVSVGGGAVLVEAAEYTSSDDAEIAFKTNGVAVAQDTATSGPRTYRWMEIGGVASDYQIKCQPVSGSAPLGSTVNSWLSMTSERKWRIDFKGQSTINVSIRRASDGVVLSSAQIKLVCT